MLKLIRKMIMKKGDSEILKELLKHHNDVNSSSTASTEVSKNKSTQIVMEMVNNKT